MVEVDGGARLSFAAPIPTRAKHLPSPDPVHRACEGFNYRTLWLLSCLGIRRPLFPACPISSDGLFVLFFAYWATGDGR